MSFNINTILRKRKNNEAFTVKDVSNEDLISQLLSKDQAFKTFTGVRPLPKFWKNQKKNSMAVIRQLGVPTLFVTASAAKTKWNKLLVILKQIVDDDSISEEQAEELIYNEKARLIQSNRITTARYFDHRFRELKKTWSKNEDRPCGSFEIVEYFRIEFQYRDVLRVCVIVKSIA